MAQYTVMFRTGAFTYVTVEADSPEQAREIADDQFDPPFVCAQCSGMGFSHSENNTGVELGDDWEQDDTDGGVWES